MYGPTFQPTRWERMHDATLRVRRPRLAQRGFRWEANSPVRAIKALLTFVACLIYAAMGTVLAGITLLVAVIAPVLIAFGTLGLIGLFLHTLHLLSQGAGSL